MRKTHGITLVSPADSEEEEEVRWWEVGEGFDGSSASGRAEQN